METKKLEALVMAVRTGSFTRAAEVLGLGLEAYRSRRG